MKRFLLAFGVFVMLLCVGVRSYAQGEDKFVTFSGFVIDAKTDEPLAGAYVINERAGRGTLTNGKGYFIINVFPGDSIVFSYLGYKKQFHRIPKNVELNYSAVVELSDDAKMLKEVKVYPFNTEEEFKLALVEMELPDARERANMEQNLSRENLDRAIALQGMSADANYRYAMSQQLQHIQNKGSVTTNPLLNPMAWRAFIRSIKDGSFNNKAYKNGDFIPKNQGSRDAIFNGSN
ncbi:carboxypeptidase-like regulatory domain-containing protein [Marinilongibacter aquaticus]|uniref:carboxypeptidase-like regulatory domain-containing protein n=1 Tax=Marinilongibacter aquaticus TaxID=2975157 RepID=UPI0021BDE1B9|nr:carboxypeptidase-like regulatory domain-containing protein [Marinilongibacter aquaticus]UBM60347.1 carboxypeptidase-like regulatory domain-containing protein [Marinilongibacter aquaticus]